MTFLMNLTFQATVQLTRKDREMSEGYLLSFRSGGGGLIQTIKKFDTLSEWLAHLSEVSFVRGKHWGEALVRWNCDGLGIFAAQDWQAGL
jgi:hypothetical protein